GPAPGAPRPTPGRPVRRPRPVGTPGVGCAGLARHAVRAPAGRALRDL
ncbi:MAG: hypothetical protein AVDCRST_MAG06-2234, partial [uncultured Nocardioides sp.]